jgi:hypothetical protein
VVEIIIVKTDPGFPVAPAVGAKKPPSPVGTGTVVAVLCAPPS